MYLDDVPEVLLRVVNKLEVGGGFFPIPTGCGRVILIWVEFTRQFYISSSHHMFCYNLIHGEP